MDVAHLVPKKEGYILGCPWTVGQKGGRGDS